MTLEEFEEKYSLEQDPGINFKHLIVRLKFGIISYNISSKEINEEIIHTMKKDLSEIESTEDRNFLTLKYSEYL
jgi:hypothetical protein